MLMVLVFCSCSSSFTLRILKIYRLFIASHNSVEKWFSSVSSEQHFASGSSVFLLAFKRMLLVSRSIDQRVVVAFERYPRPTMLEIRCFKTFSVIFHVIRSWPVSFDKHSMRFCSSFLQMWTENQCCSQIVVSRHKIRHIQRYYELCCSMKLELV